MVSVEELVEKVIVHEDKSMEIVFKYDDEMKKLLMAMEQRKGEVAFYIRLSISDADVAGSKKEESNSITSQRKLMYAYIRSHEEFAAYEVLEYFEM